MKEEETTIEEDIDSIENELGKCILHMENLYNEKIFYQTLRGGVA